MAKFYAATARPTDRFRGPVSLRISHSIRFHSQGFEVEDTAGGRRLLALAEICNGGSRRDAPDFLQDDPIF